ncbi:hypothetical protein [Neorhizobium galegae]|uniref:hypothetical protein n=1 Tax=Neorhizobium galegae TaxID=399 RepID=UPI0018D7EE69|nr:hypothetical protein [Neorhizobium galegae]
MANRVYAHLNRPIEKYGQLGTVTRITPPRPCRGRRRRGNRALGQAGADDQCYVDGTNITTADRRVYILPFALAIQWSASVLKGRNQDQQTVIFQEVHHVTRHFALASRHSAADRHPSRSLHALRRRTRQFHP